MTPIKRRKVRWVRSIVSTDDILPGRYKHMYTEPSQFAPHVFESAFPGLGATLTPGDVLVNDAVFGIGSSREQAVSALLAAGVEAVLAPSFGRIFFRNAWNLGLIALEVSNPWLEGEMIAIDLRAGRIVGERQTVGCSPVPPAMLAMLADGGLLEHMTKRRRAVR